MIAVEVLLTVGAALVVGAIVYQALMAVGVWYHDRTIDRQSPEERLAPFRLPRKGQVAGHGDVPDAAPPRSTE